MFFKHWDSRDQEVGVVVAKALFRRHPDGKFRAEPAPEIAFEDAFDGDPAWSPLLAEQDIAPTKVGTDLLIRATARSAAGVPRQDWSVSVNIPERLHYAFQVRGPAHWTHGRLGGWRRQDPELVSELPLTYALAYGGRALGPEGAEQVYDFNPSGIGFATRERLDTREDLPIPQIGALGEFMNPDPMAAMMVHGLGPIAKSWLPRRALAGTFDEDWQQNRHPRMPKDYDLRFWNAAPGPLQLDPPLAGNEEIVLTGLSHDPEPLHLRLPGVWCALQMKGQQQAQQMMVLDTVLLDVQDADQTAHTATLLWRAVIESPHRFAAADLYSGQLES